MQELRVEAVRVHNKPKTSPVGTALPVLRDKRVTIVCLISDIELGLIRMISLVARKSPGLQRPTTAIIDKIVLASRY
ncbi:MAG: hypothetical protein UW30_C0007G0013 [Candidatus Giovannonibacteria bacterium GW2011_GWA2_44_13b]|uniref:Uncharacterized protein n=2 Tax=Candidatus Giovannoniibacteriota TaxID=1752738 RepID=A0A0G1H294_9BACT|nr:MAG: hypothetical protein UW30_C0007G0013 [Candidatus Giovannonibacteria bacterium GW2011_GWA2_44_13b]OGF82612.1 MAG: hypothetical protein A2924_01055 [Candidatus Giovannonibacteria bacterium RIFCSPLOWO2_01_FULL_44_16]